MTESTTVPTVAVAATALLPERVFLSARWHGIAMINWEVDVSLVEPYLPRGVELDLFEGRTFISLVGFLFRDTQLLGWRVPWHQHFPEVNLRFYVRRVVGAEVRRGVAFIREIVPRRGIATVARWAYNEPYVTAAMRFRWSGLELLPQSVRGIQPRVTYEWRQAREWCGMNVACQGEAQPLATGSHTEFIAEHYWGYCRQRDGGTIEYRVEHPPWRVWTDAAAELTGTVAGYYGQPFTEVLRQSPCSTFVADGSPVKVYRPTRIA